MTAGPWVVEYADLRGQPVTAHATDEHDADLLAHFLVRVGCTDVVYYAAPSPSAPVLVLSSLTDPAVVYGAALGLVAAVLLVVGWSA